MASNRAATGRSRGVRSNFTTSAGQAGPDLGGPVGATCPLRLQRLTLAPLLAGHLLAAGLVLGMAGYALRVSHDTYARQAEVQVFSRATDLRQTVTADLQRIDLAMRHVALANLREAVDPEIRRHLIDESLREHMALPAGTSDEREAVAHAIACACLGNNHLWQDLALPSRAELSALIATWFPTLAALNHQNMKWKKFFYKQLCLRHELFICRAPSCAVCADQALCFGPE